MACGQEVLQAVDRGHEKPIGLSAYGMWTMQHTFVTTIRM